MFYVIIEAVIQAVLGAVGWVGRLFRGAASGAAAEAAMAATEELSFDSKDRRRARRQLKRMADEGDTAGLMRVYHLCGRSEPNRDLRIDSLRHLARVDRRAAEPLLREVIEGAEDAWVVTAAMEWAAKNEMVGLRDAVTSAKDDPRPAVSAQAVTVAKRLAKTEARMGPTAPSIG